MVNRFRVLVSDDLSESGLEPLRMAAEIDLDLQTRLTPVQLIDRIPGYHALLVRSRTQVTADVIQAGASLQVIARAGVGVDNIDLDAATRAGVVVVNAPTGNTVAAAEHTIAMLMALARKIPQADRHVRDGHWSRKDFVGSEVRGKTLGVVGLGKIALEVVQRAQGLGMRTIGTDPYVSVESAAQKGVTLLGLDEMLPQVDFLTVHVPLTEATYHLINADRLAALKRGARVLNVARGGIVEEEALVVAIESGHLSGAAVDVFAQEPLPAASPLRRSDLIILTPHLGASTHEAQEKVAEDVSLQVLDVLNGRPARYAVNAPILPPTTLTAMIPYVTLAERLGRFLHQLDDRGIDRLEITAHGPIAEYDLDYLVAAAIRGILSDVVNERVNLVNAALLAEQRNMEVMERRILHHHERYENMITLRVSSRGHTRVARGALLHETPYLVAIDDMWVDFPATGHLVLTSHNDRPGIIGRVGTLLGLRDINISFMHVGRKAPRGEAIMVLGTDEPIPQTVCAEIGAETDIRWIRAVNLV